MQGEYVRDVHVLTYIVIVATIPEVNVLCASTVRGKPITLTDWQTSQISD